MVTHALYRYGRLIVHQPSLFAYSLFDQVSPPFVKYCLLLFIGIGLAWCFNETFVYYLFIAFSCIKVLQLLLVNRNKQSIVKLTVVALFY